MKVVKPSTLNIKVPTDRELDSSSSVSSESPSLFVVAALLVRFCGSKPASAPANDDNVVRGDQYFVEEDFSPFEMLGRDSSSVMVQTLAMDGSPQQGSEKRVTLLSAQDDVGDAEFPITVITLRVTDLRGTPSVVTLRVLGSFGFITDKAEPIGFSVEPGEDEFSILFEFGGGFRFVLKK